MRSFLRTRRARSKGWGIAVAILPAIIVASLAGCSSSESSSPPPAGKVGTSDSPEAPETPEAKLHEQLRSGMFQMEAAAGSIEECLFAAREAVQKSRGELKGAFQDVLEFIDSAGSEVAEYADAPPDAAEVAKNFAAWDEKRLKAVEAGNDAMHDLRDASGLLADLGESAPGEAAKRAQELRALVLVALDDLWGVIEAFGGKPDPEPAPLTP